MATHVDWRAPSGATYVPSILYHDGLLYMTNDVGVVTCADARTGEHVWRHRLEGLFFASPVAADGKVYLVSETGDTFVLRAGPEAPEVLARNHLSKRFLASPAIARGRLFLRSDGTLLAIGSSRPPGCRAHGALLDQTSAAHLDRTRYVTPGSLDEGLRVRDAGSRSAIRDRGSAIGDF